MANKDLTNIDVTLIALLELGGFEKRVHTEEIAYKAFELDPARFGWRLKEFRERGFPDKEPVRIALKDAAKEKYGALVEGRTGKEISSTARKRKRKDADGWTFTPAGAKWIREREASIKQKLGLERSNLHPTETARFLKQIKSQPLFAKYKQNGDLAQESCFTFTDMLNVSPDTSRAVISKKFLRLCSIAELAGDAEVRQFLDACSRAFSALLARTHSQSSNQEEDQ
jgi:hypothetical protein